MRLILIVGLLSLCNALSAQTKIGQAEVYRTDESDNIWCPLVKSNEYIYSPSKYDLSSKNKTANIIFEYSTTDVLPLAYRQAVSYAGDVIGSIISSPIDIRVFVQYQDTGDENNLAGARASNYFRNFTSAPAIDTWYPIALAEKIQKSNFNGDEADIIVTINSTQQNFQLKPNSPSTIGDKIDLATVLIHEILHGIGFIGFADVDDALGTLNSQDAVAMYDRFLESASGNNLVGQYDDGSRAMGAQLTSESLFFNSSFFTGASRPKVYAPPSFSPGSSIYHLDSDTYRGTDDRIMIPFIAGSDINYDVGEITSNMLLDMGWSSVFFDNKSKQFSEAFDEIFEVKLLLDSDLQIDSTSLVMRYSTDNFQSENLETSFGISGDTLVATLPALNEEGKYNYYFEVVDQRAKLYRNPGFSSDEDLNHQFIYGVDDSIPTIDHEPLNRLTTLDNRLTIRTQVQDFFTGVDQVRVAIQLNDNTLDTLDLLFMEDNFGEFWEGSYSFPNALVEEDVVGYNIIASDKGINSNTAIFPADGSQIEITVIGVPGPRESYLNDFNDPGIFDFIGDLFERSTSSGIEGGFISNSNHPYQVAGASNTLNFVSELEFPIIISEENDFLKFEEIVLVEPGEAGAVFGSAEFWDYVIVETRKIGEENWVGLANGYDCNQQSVWLQAYNSNISNGVSSTIPVQSQFRSKEYDFSSDGGYVAGDTIQIRFRLFSDPAAAGWGWAIDNLNIQDANTNVAVEDFIQDDNQFLVYPNPSNTGQITISATFSKASTNLRTELTDIHGRLIRSERITNGSQYYEEDIDISDLPSGVYFMTLRDNESAITKKVVMY